MNTNIHFFYEEVEFNVPEDSKAKDWINNISLSEGSKIESLNYIFCSDEYLHSINLQYLNHDYYTDIITFDQSEDEDHLEGDIFISIERIEDNAHEIQSPFHHELLRVMAHGVLHLIGYDDKTDEQKLEMRKKEDSCLSLYQF